MTDVPSREVKIREKLRLWRTLFIHRWHAPQTIGELHGRPSIGMRFEHINHRESLTEYIWRYGAFRENKEGTGREDVSDTPSRANGLQAIIKELDINAPGLLTEAVEYTIIKYGDPGQPDDDDYNQQRTSQLVELASEHPAIADFAAKLYELHCNMLYFYVQMRYITIDEVKTYLSGKIPLLTPLRPTDKAGTEIQVGKDSLTVTGDPISALRETFSQNIYNALCWRARAELFEVMDSIADDEDETRGSIRMVEAAARRNARWSSTLVDDREKRFFVSDEALIATLNSLNEAAFPWLIRAMATFKTAVSTMITAMPMFIVKNFLRDTLAGFVAGRYWQTPFTSTFSGAVIAGRDLVTGHDEVMRDYLLQGGFYSGLVESEVRVDSRVHGLTGGLRFHKAQGRFKYIVHLFTRPAWVAEAGTRIHQYQQALAEGANRYDAIRAARMVSSDFANIGASRKWRMYVHTVPFMNAAIQGLDQLYQICRPEYRKDMKNPRWGLDRKQHVNKTLRAGACLAGMAFAVWLWNISDDVKLTQYLDETDYEKASYLTLYDIHDDADIRIPVPFQIGAAFMKVPEIMFDLTSGTGTLAGARYAWSLIHGNLAISWLPAVLQPVWEVKTNRNFYGAPIIPGYMANWPAKFKFFSGSTPEPMVQLGQLINVSPLHIQTFTRSWTGHLGRFVITGLDELMWNTELNGENPYPRTLGLATGMAAIQAPKFKTRSRWTERFYEMLYEAEAIDRTINNYERQGKYDEAERMEELHEGKLDELRWLHRTRRDLSEIREEMEYITWSDMSAKDKRTEIKELLILRNEIVKEAVQDAKPYF